MCIQYLCTSLGGSSRSTKVHIWPRALEAHTHQVELKEVGHNFINKHKSKRKQLILLIQMHMLKHSILDSTWVTVEVVH